MSDVMQTESARLLDVDREAWLLARLQRLVKIVELIRRDNVVRAERTITDAAVAGACHGAAIEIARMLGYEPQFVNISNLPNTYRLNVDSVDPDQLFTAFQPMKLRVDSGCTSMSQTKMETGDSRSTE